MEISNREELKRIIKSERSNYLSSKGWYQEFLKIVKSHPDYNAWLYTKQLRRTSYYYSKRNRNPFNAVLYLCACRKLNRLGRRCGIECGENVFDEGVRFFHTQGTVINGNTVR